MNRITSSTLSRTSTKPLSSCSLDRAHVAAPVPAALVTNTIWFALTRTISPSGRCRSIQPVVAVPPGDERAFPAPPVWQSRANASRSGNISAPASSARTAAAAFVGMTISLLLQHRQRGDRRQRDLIPLRTRKRERRRRNIADVGPIGPFGLIQTGLFEITRQAYRPPAESEPTRLCKSLQRGRANLQNLVKSSRHQQLGPKG